jgi:hypothetical protein
MINASSASTTQCPATHPQHIHGSIHGINQMQDQALSFYQERAETKRELRLTAFSLGQEALPTTVPYLFSPPPPPPLPPDKPHAACLSASPTPQQRSHCLNFDNHTERHANGNRCTHVASQKESYLTIHPAAQSQEVIPSVRDRQIVAVKQVSPA